MMVYLVQEELDVMHQIFLDECQRFLARVLSYAVGVLLMTVCIFVLEIECDGVVNDSVSFLPSVLDFLVQLFQ